MDRTKKIGQVNAVRGLVRKKEALIRKEQEELELLNEELEKLEESELPILLFMADHTMPMPGDERDYEYEYVYYCPDLDEVKYRTKHRADELLPNSIDLRTSFESFDMPKRPQLGRVQLNPKYYNLVHLAVSCLKDTIDHLFEAHEIQSWSDLAIYLRSISIEEGSAKSLKPKNSQKRQ